MSICGSLLESRISSVNIAFLLYMHSMIPIICAAIFAKLLSYIQMGTAAKIQCLSGSAGRCVPVF